MNAPLISDSPEARPVREVLHGIEVEDPFRWLEDQNSPATRSFIQAEQQIYREYLDRHKELRSRIELRVRELLSVPSVDLPVSDHRGGLLFLKREANEEQKAIYGQDETSTERLLISVAMFGRDSYTSLAIIQVSQLGRYLVFGVRTGGEDVQEIGIYDLFERRLLPDRLPRGFYRGLAFDSNQSGFYYVHEEARGQYRLRRAVRRHEFGEDQANDREIYHAGDGSRVRLVLQRAEDASALGYLIFSLESVPTARFLVHEFPLNRPPRPIVDLAGTFLGLRFWSSAIEACTTENAPRGSIVHIPSEHPEPRAWSQIIPESLECLDGWEQWAGRKVVHYTAGIRKLTRLYSESGELLRIIEYPLSGTTTLGQVDTFAHRLFYAHSDITAPPSIHSVDLSTGDHKVWWQQPTQLRCPAPVIENHTYRSKDGTEIALTLVHPHDSIDRIRPILLSAYGGGGASATPKFSAMLTVLTEAGFSCATAHVRGGGEGGPEWHLSGQKQRKQTSVDDLVAAAEWLIEEGFTTSQLLAIAGQSAGGLLALCGLTQKPHLFRAVLALAPLADLTRFHLFGVARGFVAELGSPDNPDEFASLYRLSPYHSVRQDAVYPAILIISGDRDKRCDALHARKMVARLKAARSPRHPTLLDYTEMRGHKPVLPLTERIRSLSNRLTFLIAELDGRLPMAQPL